MSIVHRGTAPYALVLAFAAACGEGVTNPSAVVPPKLDASVECTDPRPFRAELSPGIPGRLFLNEPFTSTVTIYNQCGEVMSNPPLLWSYDETFLGVTGSTNVTITGKKVGATSLRLISRLDGTTGDGFEDTFYFSVESRVVTRIEFSPALMYFPPGETQSYTVNQYNSSGSIVSGPAVTVTSDNPGIAQVNGGGATGSITAVSQGVTTVRASNGAQTATMSVRVGPPREQVDTFTHSPTTASLEVPQTLQIQSRAVNAYGQPFTIAWTSSDPSIATVDAYGIVTSRMAGTVTITATAGTGSFAQSRTTSITVHPGVNVSGPPVLYELGSGTYTATTLGCNTTCTIEWYVDDSYGNTIYQGSGSSVVVTSRAQWGSLIDVYAIVTSANGPSTLRGKTVRNWVAEGCTRRTGC